MGKKLVAFYEMFNASRDKYDAARDAAAERANRALAEAWEARDAASAPQLVAYGISIAEMGDEVTAAGTARHWAEYRRACDAATEEYDRARTGIMGTYYAACETALADHERYRVDHAALVAEATCEYERERATRAERKNK